MSSHQGTSIKRLTVYWTGLLACLSFVGCGQKGPLTLSEPGPESAAIEAVDSEADEESAEQDSGEQ